MTSKTRYKNLLLKLRLPYLYNTTSNLFSSIIFQYNLSFVLLVDNPSEYKLLLTSVLTRNYYCCKNLNNVNYKYLARLDI